MLNRPPTSGRLTRTLSEETDLTPEDKDLLDDLRRRLAGRRRKLLTAPEPRPLVLAGEQLEFLVSALVGLELKRRRKRLRKKFWSFMQKAGLIIAPLAGLSVIARFCGGPL